jgi:hypothetical protein
MIANRHESPWIVACGGDSLWGGMLRGLPGGATVERCGQASLQKSPNIKGREPRGGRALWGGFGNERIQTRQAVEKQVSGRQPRRAI